MPSNFKWFPFKISNQGMGRWLSLKYLPHKQEDLSSYSLHLNKSQEQWFIPETGGYRNKHPNLYTYPGTLSSTRSHPHAYTQHIFIHRKASKSLCSQTNYAKKWECLWTNNWKQIFLPWKFLWFNSEVSYQKEEIPVIAVAFHFLVPFETQLEKQGALQCLLWLLQACLSCPPWCRRREYLCGFGISRLPSSFIRIASLWRLCFLVKCLCISRSMAPWFTCFLHAFISRTAVA